MLKPVYIRTDISSTPVNELKIRPTGLLPCGSAFPAPGTVQGGVVLLDGLLLVLPAGARGGAAIGHHVFEGAAAALAGGQLSAADVLLHPPGKVVGLADVCNAAGAVPHPVLARAVGRFVPGSGGRVVFPGTACLVDRHEVPPYRLRSGLPGSGHSFGDSGSCVLPQ